MSTEEKKITALIRKAIKNARGYADGFGWGSNRKDRDIEEWGVVATLAESLKADNIVLYKEITGRGEGNDPPDCEAVDLDGKRVAIEVTELVDPQAIQEYKAGKLDQWAQWNKDSFLDALEALISRKDARYPELKGSPYPGGYTVIVYTDEPMLDRLTVASYLKDYKFSKPKYLSCAYLLVFYDHDIKQSPYYELEFGD